MKSTRKKSMQTSPMIVRENTQRNKTSPHVVVKMVTICQYVLTLDCFNVLCRLCYFLFYSFVVVIFDKY